MNFSSLSSSDRLKLCSSLSSRFSGQAQNFQYSTSLNALIFIKQSTLYQISLKSLNNGSSIKDFQCIVTGEDLKKKLEQPVENQKLSKEEELLRERQRGASSSSVINSYYLHSSGAKIVIPALKTLFYLNLEKDKIFIKNLPSQFDISSPRMDIQWSEDGKLISFVRKNNLWIYNIEKEKETKLTNFSDDEKSPISVTPDFVMQEEFDRFSGVIWSSKNNEKGMYRLAFIKVDVSSVPLLSLPTSEFSDPNAESHRFARPGEKNAIEEIFGLDFDENGSILKTWETEKPIKQLFPEIEYIVRFYWSANGDSLYLQLLDRLQKNLLFIESKFDNNNLNSNSNNILNFTISRKDNNNIWINLSDIFYATKDGGFIFSTECNSDSFRHLMISNPDKTETQLTSGNWQVDDLFAVDEDAKIIYFSASKDSPIQFHLYKLNYSTSNNIITRLTNLEFSHSSIQVDIPQKGEFVATFNFSNHKTEPSIGVLSSLNENKLIHFEFSPNVPILPIIYPEIFEFENNLKQTSYGLLYKPYGFDISKKYPTILYIYGGPHVQLVVDDYQKVITRFTKFQSWLYSGFQVVVIDGPGSFRRGLKWESILLNKMGQVELENQVLGLKSLPSVDQNRICVTGWSYGGYMSLLALIQYPQVFKFAVSGAPVTFWEAYDTGYTERYMGVPTYSPEQKEIYENSSVLKYAEKFPVEEGRLLLVHGLKDENVHFTHTSHLIRKLTSLNKPYELQVYPDERHGIREWSSWLHFETKFFSWLKRL